MKIIIFLLAALLVFALPVKAEENSNLDGQKAYLFGFIYGSGSTLCDAVQDEEITKDYANYSMSRLLDELPKTVEDKDFTTTLNIAFDAVRNADSCRDVYQ